MTHRDLLDQDPARVWFWRLFWGTLALKLVLAAVFPITGDEALFVQWGKRPDWGYYDHPPMIGWWLSVLMLADDARWLIRLLTVLSTHFVALLVVDMLKRPSSGNSPWLAGSLYLAMPWSWMFFLVTTDTPVILFMSLAAWLFWRGMSKKSLGWFWAAGTALGLAFLSKYFAVLLGMAFALAVLSERHQRVPRLLALAVPGLLCVAYNLGFNATHGWPNIMFNLFARQSESQWNVKSLGIYLLMMAYLLTPWLIWQAARRKHPPQSGPDEARTSRTAMLLWAVPLAFFALVSLRREVGLHWVLGFVPFFVVWSARRLHGQQLYTSLRYTLMLSLPHVLLVLALLAWPADWIKNPEFREKVVFFRHSPEIVQLIENDLPPGTTLMGTGYSTASILAYSHQKYVPVFGLGSRYARQDDLWTDFRAFEGRSIRIFNREPLDVNEHAPFFTRLQAGRIEYQGASYFFLDGEGFRYDAYKARVLDTIHAKYFRIPGWLPILGSPFCERYGYTDCSPGR